MIKGQWADARALYHQTRMIRVMGLMMESTAPLVLQRVRWNWTANEGSGCSATELRRGV